MKVSVASLRAFEAAARLGSFQEAAHEIHVTPSAVSYQIRNLETALGRRLFIRQHRKVVLSACGKALHTDVARAFKLMDDAVMRISQDRDPKEITVTAPPTFASGLISAGIARFEEENRGYSLSLRVSHAVQDVESEGIDVGIRYSVAMPTGVHAEKLFNVHYVPVATPEVSDLIVQGGKFARIVVKQETSLWDEWFDRYGKHEWTSHVVSVETMNVSVQSATEGLGVALVPVELIGRHLAAGRLVTVSPHLLPSMNAYWFTCRIGAAEEAKIRRFRGWLTEQIAPYIGRQDTAAE